MQKDKEFLEDYNNRHNRKKKKRIKFPVTPNGNTDKLADYFKE